MNEVQQFCRDHHPCEESARFALRHKTLAEVWANCERGDWLWWMLRENGLVTKKLSVSVAIACADRVLSLYETVNPADDRPRKAIEAARAYLERPCERLKSAARSAARSAEFAWSAESAARSAAWSAASAAAFAARSAEFAARSAEFARSAASAAASAAWSAGFAEFAEFAESAESAARSAARSAASAAWSAERKWQADKIRELVGSNPFV